MKHAYLIIAHNNLRQLQQLIKLLDSDNHDIYVHIDKKSKELKKEYIENVAKKSKVLIYQEIKVYWGGYSQVQVELYLLDKAHSQKYDYYHIISGIDLPLKSNNEIDSFFEKYKGYEFIDYNDLQLQEDPEIKRRTKLYHFLQNYRRISKYKWINNIFVFLERSLLLLQIIFQIDRTKKTDWTIKYGSQWVSITHRLTQTILSQKDRIESIFKLTNCADELFIQTVAYNCGFKNSVFKSEYKNVMDNMRLVDWKRGANGSPYTFRIEDYLMLIHSHALFARKFSESIDKEIIDKIIDYVSGEINE